jgi:hypothetical protein
LRLFECSAVFWHEGLYELSIERTRKEGFNVGLPICRVMAFFIYYEGTMFGASAMKPSADAKEHRAADACRHHLARFNGHDR